MVFTGVDVGVAVLVLISAVLATARGFTREILSLATWAGSAAIAAYMYFYHKDLAEKYIDNQVIATAVTVVGSFLVALIVLHLLTMWIGDMVVDSRVGPLDRTLGFVFGRQRGVLICIVAAVFANFLLAPKLPDMVADAKSFPPLLSAGVLARSISCRPTSKRRSRTSSTSRRRPTRPTARTIRRRARPAPPGRGAPCRALLQRRRVSPRPQRETTMTGIDPLGLEGDTLREECGVFGILGHPEAATLTALGLHALQHRGQEAAGIVSFDGRQFHSERQLGLVGDHFTDPAVVKRLPGNMAMGHVRYSTTGETILRNVQPLFAELAVGGIAIAHNGNFTNGLTLRRELIAGGAICQSTSDTEVVLHLIAKSRRKGSGERFVDALSHLEGAYSMVAMTRTKLIGARDPNGIRPLVLGDLDGCPIFASETCALDIIGATFVRDVKNAAKWSSPRSRPTAASPSTSSMPFAPQPEQRLCLFEYVYFARP